MSFERDSSWSADRQRYPRHAFLREQSIWAVGIYRLGRWSDEHHTGVARFVLDRVYWATFRVVETVTGISITKNTRVGPGLRIHHFGNIFVNERSRIGANCTLRQGVTIGTLTDDGPAPVLGDDVDLGAYAQVLGGVHVGDGARVGAMSVVLEDVPPGATAVGVPARIITSAPPRARESLGRSAPAHPPVRPHTPNPSR